VGSLPVDGIDVGTGLVESTEHGVVTRLQIMVDSATGIINEARFKTFGCGFAIASSSIATEWIKGQTLNKALLINPADIEKALNLSSSKRHCSVLAEDAVKAAIADYRKKRG
jgi:nitrogen fixation NifU-like protein